MSLCSTVPLFGRPFVRPSPCSAVPLFGLTLMTSLAPRPRPRTCCSGIPLFSMTHLILYRPMYPTHVGPHRRDDEPMMKLRRKTLIVCDRVDKNGASQAQSNEDHTSSPSARPERRDRRYQTLPKDQAG